MTPMLAAQARSEDFELVEKSSTTGASRAIAADAFPLQSAVSWSGERLRTAFGPAPAANQTPPDCFLMQPARVGGSRPVSSLDAGDGADADADAAGGGQGKGKGEKKKKSSLFPWRKSKADK
jgi:hypothetical protein